MAIVLLCFCSLWQRLICAYIWNPFISFHQLSFCYKFPPTYLTQPNPTGDSRMLTKLGLNPPLFKNMPQRHLFMFCFKMNMSNLDIIKFLICSKNWNVLYYTRRYLIHVSMHSIKRTSNYSTQFNFSKILILFNESVMLDFCHIFHLKGGLLFESRASYN